MRYEQARGLLLRSFAFCACIRGEKWDIFAPDDFLHINNIKYTMKKHNFKETQVVPRAMVPHANGEAARLGEAVLAQNVREQEQSLEVTGQPVTVGSIAVGSRLLLMGAVYASFLVTTVFFSYLTPRNLLFTLGMTLFLGCDLFVAVNNAALYLDLNAYPVLKALYDIPFNMMWAFYGPSQMLLSLSSAGGKR